MPEPAEALSWPLVLWPLLAVAAVSWPLVLCPPLALDAVVLCPLLAVAAVFWPVVLRPLLAVAAMLVPLARPVSVVVFASWETVCPWLAAVGWSPVFVVV